ncbi:MAG: MATE family efflux transporter [Paenibacillaceae bacterium]
MSSNISVRKLSLFTISWPIFVETALQMFLRTSDTFMLSSVGDDAVAAVGVANQIIMFNVIIMNFVSVGAAIVIAQYLGAKMRDEIPRLVATALPLNFLFGLLLSAIIVFFNTSLLGIFGLEEALFSQAKIYLIIVGGTLFVQAVMITISAIVQVHGFTRDTMVVVIGMNLFHVALNYCFIYGAIGFPQLGVTGVAISTLISQILGLTANLLVLNRRVQIKLLWKDIVRWKRDHVTKILKVGIPSSASQLSYFASQIVTTIFIASLGSELLTTRIYTQNIMFFVMILAISLGRGLQIIVGHLIGAREFEEANKQVMLNLGRSLILTLCAMSIIAIFRYPLLKLFTHDPDILSIGAVLILLGFLMEPGRNFNILLERSLQATGDMRFTMGTSVIVIWVFSIPLIYLLGLHWSYGLIGMWVGLIADEWVRGFILFLRWKSKAWVHKALVKKDLKKTLPG